MTSQSPLPQDASATSHATPYAISPEHDHLPQRICIVTDAWRPQVNGVVRTLEKLRQELRKTGRQIFMLSPQLFKTVPMPSYPEIRISLNSRFKVPAILRRWQPEAVHIATEGPLGWAARRWCMRNHIPFTTAYHTAFPEYIAARTPFPADWFYPMFRRFHAASDGTLVATETVRAQLAAKGFVNIMPWTRGVDQQLFHSGYAKIFTKLTGPIQLYVGRVAVEKNIEAFLETNVPGTKVVVGDGPALETLKKAYPDTVFVGALFGAELAQAYASADVFVFPSKTDTFGLVMIESLGCGTPVAAYPVQGPLDVLGRDGTGPFDDWDQPIASLQDDLEAAIKTALTLDRAACSQFAKHYSWEEVTRQFLSALSPINDMP